MGGQQLPLGLDTRDRETPSLPFSKRACRYWVLLAARWRQPQCMHTQLGNEYFALNTKYLGRKERHSCSAQHCFSIRPEWLVGYIILHGKLLQSCYKDIHCTTFGHSLRAEQAVPSYQAPVSVGQWQKNACLEVAHQSRGPDTPLLGSLESE